MGNSAFFSRTQQPSVEAMRDIAHVERDGARQVLESRIGMLHDNCAMLHNMRLAADQVMAKRYMPASEQQAAVRSLTDEHLAQVTDLGIARLAQQARLEAEASAASAQLGGGEAATVYPFPGQSAQPSIEPGHVVQHYPNNPSLSEAA